jgi:hypothetical protein
MYEYMDWSESGKNALHDITMALLLTCMQ